MSNQSSQLAEFLRLYVRLRPYLKHIVIVSGALTVIIVFAWSLSYRPSYTSETIALVRPQINPSEEETNETKASPDLFPKPLSVADYALFMKSDAVLIEVADAYNKKLGAESEEDPVSVAGLRTQLSATSRLEIKTPYAVNYYPTIEMRAVTHSAESAHDLMQAWVDVVKEQAHEITYSTKEQVLSYLEGEYQKEHDALFELQNQLNETTSEGARLIEELRQERSHLEEQYQVETIQLINETQDEWDARIADREAELNLPMVSSQVYALTDQMESAQDQLSHKQHALEEAKARLNVIVDELRLYKDSPVADPNSKLFWSVDVDENAKSEADDGGDVQDVQVPSTGVSPIAVLLSRDASQAKVAVASLPQEIEGLTTAIDTLQGRVAKLQTSYVKGDTELTTLTRKKDATVETQQTERSYGFDNVQRESERLILQLTRERQALEDQLKRDLETKSTMFAGLAQSRLRARLAVANTIDEFQILTGPSQPETSGAVGFVFFAAVVLVFMLVLVTGVYVVVFVVSDALRHLTAHES